MGVHCCYKVLIFISVSILLLIVFTNLVKADTYADKVNNYDSYQYPDRNSKYNSIFFVLAQMNFTSSHEVFMT